MPLSFPIENAARCLLKGGVIAYPTEGVYGLGCIPDYDFAVQRILDIKGRDASKGIILIAANAAQLAGWIAPDTTELNRLRSNIDYPTTWIVSARPGTPTWLTGGRDTLAVRISQHPVVSALCAAIDGPLVSTSANRSGRPPARSALSVRKNLGNDVDQVVSGALGTAPGPSEIRVAHNDKVLRPRA